MQHISPQIPRNVLHCTKMMTLLVSVLSKDTLEHFTLDDYPNCTTVLISVVQFSVLSLVKMVFDVSGLSKISDYKETLYAQAGNDRKQRHIQMEGIGTEGFCGSAQTQLLTETNPSSPINVV